MKIDRCRYCSGKLRKIVSLGNMPLVNYFPTRNQLSQEEKYPLDLCVCQKCGLAQVGYLVPKEILFRTYHYMSGASKPLVDHLETLALECIEAFHLTKKSKVLDIGSNDGSFLSTFKKKEIFCLGVEPAISIAHAAKEKGIPVVTEFFTKNLSKQILQMYGQFDLIVGTHMLANIIDIKDFLTGVKILLKRKGIAVFEVGSLVEMLTRFQFDSIYHEHFSYFSVVVLEKIFKTAGLSLIKAEKNSFHGGSLRIFASYGQKINSKVNKADKITEGDYKRFAVSVSNFKKSMVSFFKKHKKAKTAGFGAPAKGVTLLNYCGLGKNQVQFVVDSTPYKQKRFIPGVHIPIFEEKYITDKKLDFILLLAWNYRNEILSKLNTLVKKKTKVIIPFPKPEVIEV